MTPPPLDVELDRALEALVIHSPGEFTFAGRRVAAPRMVDALQAALYSGFYNRQLAAPHLPAPSTLTDMTDDLSRANPGRERWDDGWEVYQTMPDGLVHAHKHGKAQMFYPGQYEPCDASNRARVRVFLAKEMRNYQDGYYIALSEHVQPWYEQTTLARIYWHLEADAAAPMVRELVARFNAARIPFRFKCLSHRELYDRSDAGVLFVGRRLWSVAAPLVAEIHALLQGGLRPQVPRFTKRLAPGLAVAEDSGTGESFGTSRCRLIAEGIWQAYLRGQQTASGRMTGIADAFARAGLSVDRPWLTTGSVDVYEPMRV